MANLSLLHAAEEGIFGEKLVYVQPAPEELQVCISLRRIAVVLFLHNVIFLISSLILEYSSNA